MIDCETVIAADGCAVKTNFTVDCPLENVQQDSFFVSGFLFEQSVSISNNISSASDICEISPLKFDGKNVFSVYDECKTENIFSVNAYQSAKYKISNQISNQIFITIDVLKRAFSIISRHFKRIFENVKGHHAGRRVYTLCLLRL